MRREDCAPLCTRLAVVDPESEPPSRYAWVLPRKGLTFMSLHACSRRRFALAITLVTLLAPGRIFAVSCKTQAQMTEPDRAALVQAATTLASDIQSGNPAAVKASTIPNVAAQFDGIANTIVQTPRCMTGATITIDALYSLDASDLKPAGEDTQFFCGGPDFAAAHRDLHSAAAPGPMGADVGTRYRGETAATNGVSVAEEWQLAAGRLFCEAAYRGWTRQPVVLDPGSRLYPKRPEMERVLSITKPRSISPRRLTC